LRQTGHGFQGITPAAGGLGIDDTALGLPATLALSANDVGRPSFTLPVQGPGIPFPCSRGNTSGSTCNHGLTRSGTISFTRIERCEPLYSGYVCKLL
jgi:hypothetical protein